MKIVGSSAHFSLAVWSQVALLTQSQYVLFSWRVARGRHRKTAPNRAIGTVIDAKPINLTSKKHSTSERRFCQVGHVCQATKPWSVVRGEQTLLARRYQHGSCAGIAEYRGIELIQATGGYPRPGMMASVPGQAIHTTSSI